jgi:hypothetical protein
MFDLLREIKQALTNNKVRTALTGLAVAWGIFMLIVLLGMSRGVTNAFAEQFAADNSRVINIYNGTTSKAFKGYQEGRSIYLKSRDMPAVMSRDKQHVDAVIASKSIDTAVVSTPLNYTSGLLGHFPSELKTARLEMLSGRFLNQSDLDNNRKVIVLSKENADKLFGKNVGAVGKRVDSMGFSWLVIGVYDHRWERSSYIPFTTAMLLSGNDDKVSDMRVAMKNVETLADGEAVENNVKSTLAGRHDFSPSDNSAVYIWNRFSNYLTQLSAMNILTVAVWIIGIFTLLSGIVGVSNIMFVSVRERTHEIGIRRAIGAKPRAILMQIVAESVVMTTVFGYVGVVLGMIVTGIIDIVTRNMEFLSNPTVNLSIALEVTVVLIIAGAIAGLFPAIKATKVKPVEALRDE